MLKRLRKPKIKMVEVEPTPRKRLLPLRMLSRLRPRPIVWSKQFFAHARKKRWLSKLRPRPIVWLKKLFAFFGRIRNKIRRSIRRRLPLSYAAIALITAVSIGIVLINSLDLYFTQRERAYLDYNARIISEDIRDTLITDGLTEDIKTRITNFALLTQTRARVYDAQNLPIADTGPWDLLYRSLVTNQPVSANYLIPDGASLIDASGNVTTVEEQTRLALEQTRLALEEGVLATETAVIEAEVQLEEARILAEQAAFSVEESNEAVQQDPSPTNIATQLAASEAALMAQSRVTEAEILLAQAQANVQQAELIAQLSQTLSNEASIASLGDPWLVGPPSGQSYQHVHITLFDEARQQPIGMIELSGGPSYGNDVVNSVTAAWFISSAIAVLLAAFIGWRMSRRLTKPVIALTDATALMAEGELATRVDIQRDDEIGVLANAFNEMAGQVETTVDTLKRFVADAAHELNTPLTALRNSLDLAVMEESVEGQQALVKHGRLQVERLEALTKGLLNLSRLEAEPTLNRTATFDLTNMLLKTNEQFASQAEQANLTLHIDVPNAPIYVTGNKMQIHQAIGNLIDNAIKFTPEGGTVTLQLTQEEQWLTLAVSDTGIGIPDADLPHLFSRFHRGRNTAAYPGSGLGLAIVKAVAKAHGGTVAASNRAQGAMIQLFLPT
ncbi:MAG: HAMP domain-containing sensor histidine kinase [Chloroflexota bacterium]